MKKVIVSLTSWPARICNVTPILQTILKQTIKPQFIELNLAVDEFPEREKSLPKDLVNLVQDTECIEINWCDVNTWTFNKIIPTLKKFMGEDYYLVSIDDDFLYRNDFIEKSIENLERIKLDAFNFSGLYIFGSRQVYRASIFTPDFWEDLTQAIINTKHDDGYIYYYLRYIKKARIWCIDRGNKEDPPMFVKYNEVCPLSGTTTYPGFLEIKDFYQKLNEQ